MARSLKSVRHLLQDKPTLQRLGRELAAQKALLADVRQCLPADLAAHCAAAQLRDDTLVLHVDSAAWATRLRYLAPQLARALATEYRSLRTVKVRLLIAQSRQDQAKTPAQHSDRAAKIIHNSADHANSAALQTALRRLGDAVRSR